MEEELISKKDLLEAMDISYGQLYRWKRKGLIPEDWFIKKSSYTGQETYFPRFKVLSRIEKIKNMKEDVSLDDLADVFTPTPGEVSLSCQEIISRGIVSADVFKLYQDFIDGETLAFNDILALSMLGRLITAGDISIDEGRTLLEVVKMASVLPGLEASEVYIMRKLGVISCFIVKPLCNIITDKSTKVISRLNLAVLTEEIKLKLV